jgi:hypothetical protein
MTTQDSSLRVLTPTPTRRARKPPKYRNCMISTRKLRLSCRPGASCLRWQGEGARSLPPHCTCSVARLLDVWTAGADTAIAVPSPMRRELLIAKKSAVLERSRMLMSTTGHNDGSQALLEREIRVTLHQMEGLRKKLLRTRLLATRVPVCFPFQSAWTLLKLCMGWCCRASCSCSDVAALGRTVTDENALR